jgi:hypothetical protein
MSFFLHSFTNTFFIDTSTIETIDTGLKNIALAKNVGSTSQEALQWLRNKPDEWLLFFDNADDPKVNLNKFLPCVIMATSSLHLEILSFVAMLGHIH